MASPTTFENQRLMPIPPALEQIDSDLDRDKKSFPKLKEASPSWPWRVGMPAALLAVPVAYLVILGIVAYLHGKQQSTFGDNTLEVLQLASTLWPISFAAVVGPFLKTLALFRAERGSTLGSLEFLLTSQTTIAALKNLFTLQYIQIWTIAIVALWTFSPLGGQAAVRSLHLQPNTHTLQVPAAHYVSRIPLEVLQRNIQRNSADIHSTTYETLDNVFQGGSLQQSLISGFRRTVIAAFSRPDIQISHSNGSSDGFDAVVTRLGGASQAARLGQQDIWRNVRIPFMEFLTGYDKKNATAWISVPSGEVIPYASFVGVPIRGGSFDRAGNSSMVLQSRYQTLKCGEEFDGASWLEVNDTDSNFLFHTTNTTMAGKLSDQISLLNDNSNVGTKPSMWLDLLKTNATRSHFYNRSDSSPKSELQLIVGGDCLFNATYAPPMIRVCNVSTSYVDVAVDCTRLSNSDDLTCQAKRIRRSPDPGYSTYLTDLSLWPVSYGLVYEMPFTTATYGFREGSLLERYIKDPPKTFNTGREDNKQILYPACFSNVSQTLFDVRLSTALNTFLMAAYNSTILTGADGASLENRDSMWQNTTATWTEFAGKVYTMDVAWFCISIASTFMLLGCATANVIIRHLTLAPDFLNSVDGLTRDSPFIKIPDESPRVGSGVNSRDRLQATKHVRVQIRDVNPDMDTGKIVLTTETNDNKLDWKRIYT
ncbi:hypothetical protein NW762_014338 [Fusarium torreyae]|uniref:Uncharacterized protein n=1 Tax=Fusarium torreyae TaxID=1237075 RepID=A0A9W8RIZ6_9HYPO|nr:hypothetical protein NW762_014338 [Fusarium torreyae]